MARIMIFIDGTWLYRNLSRLRREFREEEYGIDYGKLPSVIAEKISEALGTKDVDVVRTCLFGSYPDPDTLVDGGDKKAARRQLEFFGLLKEEFHYEVEPFPIDFQGHRYSKKDRDAEYMELGSYVDKIKRDQSLKSEESEKLEKELGNLKENDYELKRALDNPKLHINTKRRLLSKKWGCLKASKYFALNGVEIGDKWDPKEKCVDISLSTNMLYFAAIPYAYDISVAVIGDGDYIPVFQHVRRLGKRIMIVSIRGSCAEEFFAPADPQRLRDFDTLFLNDILGDIRLELKKEKRQCHSCKQDIWEAYFLRKGQKYYCPECREKHYLEVRSRYAAKAVSEPTALPEEASVLSEEM